MESLPTPSLGGRGKKRVVETQGKVAGKGKVAEDAPVVPAPAPAPAPAPLTLLSRSQAELVEAAFVGPDLEADFAALKNKAIDDELGLEEKRGKIVSEVKTGWGDWAGPGEVGISAGTQTLLKRKRLLARVDEEAGRKKAGRRDAKKLNVVLSERRVKTASVFKVAEVPHPFRSIEEYNRSLQMPLCDEWNTSQIVRKSTKPEVMLRAGRLVEPAKLDAAARREQGDAGAMAIAAGAGTVKKGYINKVKSKNKAHKK